MFVFLLCHLANSLSELQCIPEMDENSSSINFYGESVIHGNSTGGGYSTSGIESQCGGGSMQHKSDIPIPGIGVKTTSAVKTIGTTIFRPILPNYNNTQQLHEQQQPSKPPEKQFLQLVQQQQQRHQKQDGQDYKWV